MRTKAMDKRAVLKILAKKVKSEDRKNLGIYQVVYKAAEGRLIKL